MNGGGEEVNEMRTRVRIPALWLTKEGDGGKKGGGGVQAVRILFPC